MKRTTKLRICSIICTIAMVLAGIHATGIVGALAAETTDSATDKPTVWVVGDSTVSAFSDAYYYPRYGWGTQLDKYLDDTFTVNNLAMSGRSSKSYVAEENYKKLTAGMKKGDYLFIGFGHNDEKAEADRYTNPNGDYKTEGSFANSLYENYIKPATEAGTTVVLCTPIVRRTATTTWMASNLHVTADATDVQGNQYPGGDYAESIRQLGKDLGIAVVDMTSLTKALYDELGPDETVNLHSWTSSKSGSVDNTHTNIYGGTYNAYLIMKTVKELKVAGIADHITNVDKAPVKAEVLKPNPDYKEAVYQAPTTKSALAEKAGIFSPTAFGNLGGEPSKKNQILEQDENGNYHIQAKGNKGKIASTADGLVMYYYAVPAASNFTITAKVAINSFDVNDQVSFGLMARDDMYIDKNTTDALGDYVVAGPLKLKTAAWNCFARKSGVLTKGGDCKNSVKIGDTVDLKIESNSDGYACTFGSEDTITGGFDFKLTTVDSDYVYVGMFASRNADVTFSDVKLVVDGKEVVEGAEVTPATPEEKPTETPAKEEETKAQEQTTAEAATKAEEATTAEATKAEEATTAEATTKAEEATTAEAATKAEEATTAEATTKAEEATTAEASTKAEEATTAEATTKAEEATTAEATTKAEEKTTAEAATKAEETKTEQTTTAPAKTEKTTVAVGTVKEADAPEVVVANQSQVEDAVLTTEEKEAAKSGSVVSVSLNVKAADKNVKEEDTAAIQSAIKDTQKVGLYLDITLDKTVAGKKTNVTETKKGLALTITLPKTLVNTDSKVARTYKVVRLHNGKADILDCIFDAKTGTITFTTDKFSLYSVVYEDKTVNNETVANDTKNVTEETAADKENTTTANSAASGDKAVQTGDSFLPVMAAVLLLAVSAAVIVMTTRKKSEE